MQKTELFRRCIESCAIWRNLQTYVNVIMSQGQTPDSMLIADRDRNFNEMLDFMALIDDGGLGDDFFDYADQVSDDDINRAIAPSMIRYQY